MAERRFVPQTLLDRWADQGQIEIDGQGAVAAGRRYRLTAAVRFLKLVGSDRDPHGLLGKVKAEQSLREMGAESCADSVIVGEVAYEVQPGFVMEELTEPAAARPEEPAPQPTESEADLLARFLLDKVL